jgi:hypothetical protein
MTEFVPSEKGMPIRNPSTANLYIDSLDRSDGQSVADFIINKPTNIMTGFFTRLALNEVVMDWSVPNVLSGVNNEFSIIIGSTQTDVLIDTGFYTVADCIGAIRTALNTAIGAGAFSIVANARGASLVKATGNFQILETPLSTQLNCQINVVGTSFAFFAPVLLNNKYIDFVSNSLTYCQDVKDASTSQNVRDVIYRWYFGWDNETIYDTYNYPILQGYRAFLQRRSIAFPKQIKWTNTQPIGQLQFQVYDSLGDLLDIPSKNPENLGNLSKGEMEFGMTLLVSEV